MNGGLMVYGPTKDASMLLGIEPIGGARMHGLVNPGEPKTETPLVELAPFLLSK